MAEGRQRRVFTAEFKGEAVRRMAERRAAGVALKQIARELDVRDDLLRKWQRQVGGRAEGGRVAPAPADVFPGQGRPPADQEDLRRLERENARLKQEVAFLKTAAAYARVLREGVAVSDTYAAIRAYRGEYPGRLMGEVLDVSPSGFYAAQGRPPGARAAADARLRVAVRAAHRKSQGRYGAPRVHRTRRAAGTRVGRKRVARVKREDGRAARRAPRRVRTTDSAHALPVAPNVVARGFAGADQPGLDRPWVSDFTSIPTREGWLFLAVVLDLASRRVVGWAVRETMETALVLAALRMARADRRPAPGVVCHSDRGSQYASGAYQALLTAHGAVPSMSRKGDCHDCEYAAAASPPRLTRAYDRPRVLALICRRGRGAVPAAGREGVTQ